MTKRTWVYWANVLLVQWMFIRITRYRDDQNPDKTSGFGLLGFVVPLTGWFSDYKSLGGIWKLKIVDLARA